MSSYYHFKLHLFSPFFIRHTIDGSKDWLVSDTLKEVGCTDYTKNNHVICGVVG